MKPFKLLAFPLAVLCLLSACHKEQKSADLLQGTWNVNELQWANGAMVEKGSDVHKLEFLPCEQAYTATCTGVYHLEYADTLKKDLLDTFRFEIKEDEIAISNVKLTQSSNTFVSRFFKQRFTIETLSKDGLKFKRIYNAADSTAGYIAATKL